MHFRRQLPSRNRAAAALGVWLALAMVAGCGRRSDRTGDGGAEAGPPVPGGTAVVALAADPDVLNPLLYSSTIAGLVIAELHDGLTDMDEDLAYAPRIARSWDVSPDGLSVTYHLRPWNWSDGAALTARDVVGSLDLFKDERVASPRRGLFRDVLRAVAVDDSTVRYDLARRLPDPVQATWHHILPWHIVGGLDPAAVATWSGQPGTAVLRRIQARDPGPTIATWCWSAIPVTPAGRRCWIASSFASCRKKRPGC